MIIDAPESSRPITSRRSRVFLGMVALLPLHTVALHLWISWKPWLVLLGILAAWQAVDGLRSRTWPWHPTVSIAITIFLAAVAVSWSGDAPERYARLLLALVVGALTTLVTERELRTPGMFDRTLRVIFWSAAALATTALLTSLLAAGTFGSEAIETVNDLPGVSQVTKEAYLSDGFVAITNWHEDPGYAAAWMNLWAALALMASLRGRGSGRALVDACVVGGLWLGVVLTLSRTGLLGIVVTVLAVGWRERHRMRRALQLLAVSAAAAALLLGTVWLLDRPGVGGDLSEELGFRLSQGLTLGPGQGDEGGAGASTDYRGVVWPQYFEFFRENPTRGIGLGTGWAAGIQEPHNIVLELLGETGLVGFAGFTLLLVMIARSASNPIGRTALVVALSAAITQTVLFEATWWFAAGLALAPSQDET